VCYLFSHRPLAGDPEPPNSRQKQALTYGMKNRAFQHRREPKTYISAGGWAGLRQEDVAKDHLL